MVDNQKQDVDAWPSDFLEKEKFNIVEFYHKILWASQQEQEQYQHYEDHNKTRKRVTFSVEPPEIYEYEPEYTTSTSTSSFLSDYFKRKLHPIQNEQFPTKRLSPKLPVPPLLLEDYFKDKTIVRVRSITDFNPVPNQFYKQQQEAPAYHDAMHTFDPTFMHIDMSFEIEHQEDMYALSTCAPADLEDSIAMLSSPPPSYSDQECMIKRKKSLTSGLRKKISLNFWSSHNGESAPSTTSTTTTDCNTAEKKGIIRTLRKIKSSPRLTIQRRASVASLRKKASFLGA